MFRASHTGIIVLLLTVLAHQDALAKRTSGYFWHVSDFHLDVNFTTRSGSDVDSLSAPNRDYFLGEYNYEVCWEQGGSGKYGDYNCDSSLALIQSATNFIKAHSAEIIGEDLVKFVLWTGDDTSHAENEHFDEDLVLNVIQTLTDELKAIGLPVFPVLGNHDFHPKNQAPDEADGRIYQETAEFWRNWLSPSDAYAQYKSNGGFYTIDPDPEMGIPFRMVGLNTNIYKLKNYFTEDDEDPLGQFLWVEEILAQAERSQEKVLLFAHIPPGKFERFYQYYEEMDMHGFPWFANSFNERYLAILDRYAGNILIQFYAHHHTDTFKVMRSPKDGAITSFGLLVPGVTPWISTLAPETGGNNPGLRLYEYDLDSGEILDYQQFWLNLARANADGEAFWELEYRFLDYYNLKGPIDVQLISGLVDQLSQNSSMFHDYYTANTVQFEEGSEDTCDDVCLTYHLCTISEQDYSRFEDCIQSHGLD